MAVTVTTGKEGITLVLTASDETETSIVHALGVLFAGDSVAAFIIALAVFHKAFIGVTAHGVLLSLADTVIA
ncbi:MAG: hypothetical protein Greene041662_200, partial [Candidatus Peregrinibacteria bacterium Greene0416_62]